MSSCRRRGILATSVAVLLIAACGASGASPAATSPAGSAASTSAPAPPPSSSAAASPATPPSPGAAPNLQGMLDYTRAQQEAPGAMALVEVDGSRTFLSSGAADLAGTPIDRDTRFRIASITKPIVSALVLDAVARGELALDDDVAKILPDVVRPEPPITVRQVLSHTSGVFDEGNEGDPIADIEKLADPARKKEAKDLLARLDAGDDVVASAALLVALAETHDRYFAPGDGYHYSNPNYLIAGLLLEKVTGKPLADLLRERIVEPLGLRRTTLAPADRSSPEMRGYVQASAGESPTDVTDNLVAFGNGGNGGILSTPDELLTMLQAIVTGRLVPAELVTEMTTPVHGDYGLGLARLDLPCGTFYSHNGLVNGTASTAMVSADGSRGAVVALNLSRARDPNLPAVTELMVCGGQ